MASCHPRKRDWLLRITASLIAIGYVFVLIDAPVPATIHRFSHAVYDLLNTMSIGIAMGIVSVGLLSFVPREAVLAAVGPPQSKRGILRATAAGLMLDLCNHGILMVGMKLYERGASLAQVMAFLIASPWNSYSLTLILISLIGLPLTFTFIILSAVIAWITGMMVRALVMYGKLPKNPNSVNLPADFSLRKSLGKAFAGKFAQPSFYFDLLKNGFSEGRMVLRWTFFGIVLTSLLRVVWDADQLQTYFGPTFAGLALTLLSATVLEVCSEGSSPLAAELVTKANAPGNAFAFLMTGVSTDYTEILSLKEYTRSWKVALALPILTVPQVVVVGSFLN